MPASSNIRSVELALSRGLRWSRAMVFLIALAAIGSLYTYAAASNETLPLRVVEITAPSAESLLADAERAYKRAEYEEAEALLDRVQALAGDSAQSSSDRYRFVFLRGNLSYRRDRPDQALPYYERAAQIARASKNASQLDQALNNIGTSWRRIGDYHQALEALRESMDVRKAEGLAPSGNNLMNIADVYAQMGYDGSAEAYYKKSLSAYADAGDIAGKGHLQQTVALWSIRRKQYAKAERWLRDALASFERDEVHARPFRLRAYATLAQLAFDQKRGEEAARWLDEANEYASRHPDLVVPVELKISNARLRVLHGDAERARRELEATVATIHQKNADLELVLHALSYAQEADGDTVNALKSSRRAMEIKDWLKQRSDDIAARNMRFRIDRDARVEGLRNKEHLRTQQLWALAALGLVLATLAGVYGARMRWRTGLREAARQARHEEEIAHYRRQAEELRLDRRLFQASLDSGDDTLLILDARGDVLAATRRASEFVQVELSALIGTSFAEYLPVTLREAFMAALDRWDDGAVEPIEFRCGQDAAAWTMVFSDPRDHEGALLVRIVPTMEQQSPLSARMAAVADRVSPGTEIAEHNDAESAYTQGALSEKEPVEDELVKNRYSRNKSIEAKHSAHDSDDAHARLREEFRRALVELMLAAVEIWERSMHLNRLELAERSRIWRISVDDGRLRARTLDRYLSLAKLPKHPHWRDVLRTAYFVLEQCPLDDSVRAGLQAHVDSVLAYTRRSAMA
jgi:two-component system, sensor histidine kinase ChiS